MTSIQDRMRELEERIKKSKVNKATEHAVGTMKAQLAKLEEQLEKKSSGSSGAGYAVKKQGDATVVLVGFPSVGKSTLLNALTSAKSKVAAYDFTTLKAIPGMLEHKGAKIQLIDAPGIIQSAAKGKGRGREVISVMRSADLILIVLDSEKTNRLEIIKQELRESGIRLDQKPPNVMVNKTDKGGLIIESTVMQKLSNETIKGVLKEFGLLNAEVLLREQVSIDRLIDALSTNRKYIKSLLVINKTDLLSELKLKKIKEGFPDAVLISAAEEQNLDELKDVIWGKLEFVRVYPKPPGKEVSNEPVMLRGSPTIKNLVESLRFSTDYFSHAQVWGVSARFPGQKVGLTHELKDKDVVTVFFK